MDLVEGYTWFLTILGFSALFFVAFMVVYFALILNSIF